MAIVQISQIQVRRGLNSDLPQLASGEMGWSLDTRQLYIGNGTTAEGAPTEGITEILTQYSNLLEVGISYTFQGTESGYTSITGPNALSPVVRTLQQLLDEDVSVKDFGAKGNGTTDDTVAINRAIQQVYYSGLNGTSYINSQRVIKFPAGTYIITGQILLPPNITIVGDGRDNTVISSTYTGGAAFVTCDSLFQTGAGFGTNGATLPKAMSFKGLTFALTGSAVLFYADSVTGIVFDQVKFSGGTYNLAVYNSKATSNYVKIEDSVLTGSTTAPIYEPSDSNTGLITRTNYFDTRKQNLPNSTATTITSLSAGAGVVRYQLTDLSNNYRIGELKYNNSNGVLSFDDEWTEPLTSMGANLYATASGNLVCTPGNVNISPYTTTFKYNITQFV